MSDFYLALPSHSSKTEFPNNKSNHFKIRLPHPKKLEGSGWKVGLTAISLPDSHCRVPVFTEGQYPLFKIGWKRSGPHGVSTIDRNYTPEDVLVNFDAVDGVGFMKSMVNFFEQRRISDDGADSNGTFGWKFTLSGKRTYIKFKWEGEELVTDNEDTSKTSAHPYFMIRKDLAHKMKWVIKKDDGKIFLGPNLQQELWGDTVPNLNAPGVREDVQKANKQGVFWTATGETYYKFSYHCNWRFINLNAAFQAVVGATSRSLFVYSDVGGSGVVGNQVTDLLREVNFIRRGFGIQYFEPLHIQYIPVRKDLIDIIETQVAETTGELVDFGEGNTIVTLHFKQGA